MQCQVSSERSNMSLFEALTSLQPKELPIEPLEYKQFQEWKKSDSYKKASWEERNKREGGFYSQEFIKEYMEEKWRANLINRDSIMWLLKYRNEYKPSEVESHVIEQKLIQFVKFLGDQKNVFSTLRIDLKKLGIQNIAVKKADWTE